MGGVDIFFSSLRPLSLSLLLSLPGASSSCIQRRRKRKKRNEYSNMVVKQEKKLLRTTSTTTERDTPPLPLLIHHWIPAIRIGPSAAEQNTIPLRPLTLTPPWKWINVKSKLIDWFLIEMYFRPECRFIFLFFRIRQEFRDKLSQ